MSNDPQRKPPVWNRADRNGIAYRGALASALWLIFAWINIWPRGWGYTYVNWGWWQWLPRPALEQEPLTSLWLLHAQPPVMNAFLALFVRLEQLGVMQLATGATLLMGATIWLACCVWFEVAWRVLRSFPLACAVLGLLLLNPAFDTFAGNYYYPNVEMLGLGVLTLSAESWSRRPSGGRLLMMILAWGMMIYTRALWHPATGLALAGLLGIHLLCRGVGWPRALKWALIVGLLCLGLAAPWSLKNLYYFNTNAFSSWVGVNTQNLTFGSNPLWEFSQSLTYDPALVRGYYSDAQWARLQGHPAVTIEVKTDAADTPNMNFLGVPALGAEAVRATWKGYQERPQAYLIRLSEHWIQTDLPPFYKIYTYDYKTGDYQLDPSTAYGRWFEKIYYGGWLRPYWSVKILDYIWRPSFYILTVYPMALVGALWRLRRLRRPRGFVSAWMLLAIAWVWAMLMFVDGNEGARMRWHVEPIILIFCCWTLLDLRRCLRARRLSRRSAS